MQDLASRIAVKIARGLYDVLWKYIKIVYVYIFIIIFIKYNNNNKNNEKNIRIIKNFYYLQNCFY